MGSGDMMFIFERALQRANMNFVSPLAVVANGDTKFMFIWRLSILYL